LGTKSGGKGGVALKAGILRKSQKRVESGLFSEITGDHTTGGFSVKGCPHQVELGIKKRTRGKRETKNTGRGVQGMVARMAGGQGGKTWRSRETSLGADR